MDTVQLRQLSKQLEDKFNADYKKLRQFRVELPKGRVSVGHVDMLSRATAFIREASNISAETESRWMRVHQEFREELERRTRRFDRHIEELADNTARTKSLAERRSITIRAQPDLQTEETELEEMQNMADKAKGWWDHTKRRHALVREAHSDVLTMSGLLKILVETNQLTPAGSARPEEPFEQHSVEQTDDGDDLGFVD